MDRRGPQQARPKEPIELDRSMPRTRCLHGFGAQRAEPDVGPIAAVPGSRHPIAIQWNRVTFVIGLVLMCWQIVAPRSPSASTRIGRVWM